MFIFLTPVIEDYETTAFCILCISQYSKIKCNLNNFFMDMKFLIDTLAHSLMCYLMATCIYQEIYKIQFRGNSNGMCVHTFKLKRNQLLQSDGLYNSMKSHILKSCV